MSSRLKDFSRQIKAFLKDERWVVGLRICIYAQEGEDAVLTCMFDKKINGFYVDIGCHHPHRFSNSYAFYRRGWR